MTTSPPPISYDAVPYRRQSYACTHPDRLASLAILLGLTPAPVDRCRVLEIGCASGDNLIPMAQTLPESQFVGIDLSERQIAVGQADIRALGLPNITLRQLDLLDVNAAQFGQFDYIIAHGVYSWVPPAVRDKLLAICQDHLAPSGIAYISYNVYPGWHFVEAVRHMMLYRTRGEAEPQRRAAQARSMLDFAVGASRSQNALYSAFLKWHRSLSTGRRRRPAARRRLSPP